MHFKTPAARSSLWTSPPPTLTNTSATKVLACSVTFGSTHHQNLSHTDAHAEKVTRGLLRAAAHRGLQRPNTVVLLDYMCGIKGYRYELWCMARERATRCALLHCTLPLEVAEAWRSNSSVPPSTAALPLDDQGTSAIAYIPHQQPVFDDLWQRFEVPDTRNRWDRPLIEVDPRDADATQSAIAAAVAALLGTVPPRTNDSHLTMMQSQASSEHAYSCVEGRSQGRVLKPTVATSRQLPTDATRRTLIDQATQAVVQRVMDAQVCCAYGVCLCVFVLSKGNVSLMMYSSKYDTYKTSNQASCGGVGPVHVAPAEPGGVPVTLPESVPLAVLRGHKRSFMRIATQVLGGRVDNETAVQRMFLEYIIERCR